MRRCLAVLLLTLLWALPAHALVVDGVLAAVEERVIPLSTFTIYRAVFAFQKTPDEALQQLIDDRLLAREARRYGQGVSKPALAAEQARLAQPAALTTEEWNDLLNDRLLAKQFLAFRFGDFVPITREELLDYYNGHRAEFPGTFAQSEERIRTLLTPGARAKREAAYVSELRDRVDIRINTELLPRE